MCNTSTLVPFHAIFSHHLYLISNWLFAVIMPLTEWNRTMSSHSHVQLSRLESVFNNMPKLIWDNLILPLPLYVGSLPSWEFGTTSSRHICRIQHPSVSMYVWRVCSSFQNNADIRKVGNQGDPEVWVTREKYIYSFESRQRWRLGYECKVHSVFFSAFPSLIIVLLSPLFRPSDRWVSSLLIY